MNPQLASYRRLHVAIDLAVLLLVLVFLVSYFDPELILSDTTTAGGDTPSHLVALERLREFVLEHGQITGWDYGNLAGFPLFQYYFPLPFLAGVLLSLAVPLTIAFKLMTVAGIFLLPVASLYFLRRLGLPFPVPAIGALGSLTFLLVESQSMWGGNIMSTLAGEFSYSHGMAMVLFFLAAYHSGLHSPKRRVWPSAALLALTGLSHGCALLVGGAVAGFYLLVGNDTYQRLLHYLKVNLAAFLLMAFWLVPWLTTQEYMTAFNFRWRFDSLGDLFPPILLPFYGLAMLSGLHLLWTLIRRKAGLLGESRPLFVYFWFAVLICLIYFRVGYRLNVVDIRFVPFVQLFLVFLGAAYLGLLLQRFPLRWPFAVALALLTLIWSDHWSTIPPSWIKWNYEGFEAKTGWPILEETNRTLAGSFADGRVVYEHSAEHDKFGSVRTFEALPYFAGRATLEGLYLQSSVNSPFIFYLQAEISKTPSCPLPEFECTPQDLAAALPHLSLFNATHLILRSPEAKQQASRLPALSKLRSLPPLEIYRLKIENRYVTPLPCPPVLYQGREWRQEAYQWFRDYQEDSLPVAIAQAAAPGDEDHFAEETSTFPVGEVCSQGLPPCRVESTLEHDRIRISTDCLDRPLLVKTSYHPRWRVEGANQVYLVTPGFMLIFPHQPDVTLSFGWSITNYLGSGLTLIALALALTNALGWWDPGRMMVGLLPIRALEWLNSEPGSRGLKWSLVAVGLMLVGWLAR